MPRPIDRNRLRAELLKAGRLLTVPLTTPDADAFRVGGVTMVLLAIAGECDMPDVRGELSAMIAASRERERALHEVMMGDYRERTATVAQMAEDLS